MPWACVPCPLKAREESSIWVNVATGGELSWAVQKCCLSKFRPCFFSPSAGIGRTGVLVTMETAMCLIERNLPVYPLDIVRKMRDQRAMMVQTSVSRSLIIKILTMARPVQRALQVKRPRPQGTESLAHGHRACQGLSSSNAHPSGLCCLLSSASPASRFVSC